MSTRHKSFLVLYTIFFAIIVTTLITSDKAKLIISKFTFSKQPEKLYVQMDVVSNIDPQSHVIIRCYIPCRNKEHKSLLLQMMPRIKNDILEKLPDKMSVLVKERQFEVLKERFLEIINQYSNYTITNLYFEKVVTT